MRRRIDIVQANPRAEASQFARKVGHMRTYLPLFPFARLMLDIDPIGRRVLAAAQQFLRSGRNELFGFAPDRIGSAADEHAAPCSNDAAGTATVSALRNLDVPVITRCAFRAAPT